MFHAVNLLFFTSSTTPMTDNSGPGFIIFVVSTVTAWELKISLHGTCGGEYCQMMPKSLRALTLVQVFNAGNYALSSALSKIN